MHDQVVPDKRVKHVFNQVTLLIIINLLVMSKIDYCNCSVIWSSTSESNIKKIQLLQNFALHIHKIPESVVLSSIQNACQQLIYVVLTKSNQATMRNKPLTVNKDFLDGLNEMRNNGKENTGPRFI